MAVIDLSHLPKQQDFYFDPSRTLAYVGGIGTGKTVAGADKMLALWVKYPAARKFVFSNTFPQLKSGTMQTYRARCQKWGIEYTDRVRDKYVRLKRRVGRTEIEGVLETWTAADRELFRSLEVDFAHVDEGHLWGKLDFLTLLGRLRGFDATRERYGNIGQQLWVTANPPHTTDHWLVDYTTKPANELDDDLKDVLFSLTDAPVYPVGEPVAGSPAEGQLLNPREPDSPTIKLYTSSTFDNPFLPPAYIRGLLETMDPELVDIELKGNYGDIGHGKIWRRFARSKHVISANGARDLGIPPLEWDPETEVCWGQDFNYDPLCTVLFQWRRLRVQGFQAIVMYVLGEIRARTSLIADAAEQFANNPKYRLPFEIAKHQGMTLYGDPSGNAQNRQTGVSDWIALRRALSSYGLVLRRRIPLKAPARRDRYNAGNAKLENGLGQVGVVLHPRCTYTATDLNTAFFKPGTDKPMETRNEDGGTMLHLADAWSYPIAEDYPVAAPVRSDQNTRK